MSKNTEATRRGPGRPKHPVTVKLEAQLLNQGFARVGIAGADKSGMMTARNRLFAAARCAAVRISTKRVKGRGNYIEGRVIG